MNRDDWYLRYLRIKCRVAKEWSRFRGKDRNPDMALFVRQYERIWRDAALAVSADFKVLADGYWEIRFGNHATLVSNFKVQIDDPVVMDLAGNKPLCYALMRREGLAVPEHVSFRLGELSDAKRFFEERPGRFFVVKPAKGTAGSRGVTTYVATYREFLPAGALASLFSDEILVEHLIPGESYRFLVLDGAVVHVSRRRGYRVTGDGSSNIRKLFEAAEARKPASKRGDFGRLFRDDRDLRTTLDAQGLSPESIPRQGEEILVRSRSVVDGNYKEYHTFYDEAVTDVVCADLKNQAAGAARAVRSRFAGVDVITVDPAIPLARSGGAINEVNTTPALHNHYNLLRDGGEPAAAKVLDYLLAAGATSINGNK